MLRQNRVMAGLRARMLSTHAGQLGRPHGRLGRFVAAALNRGNRAPVTAAVEASEVGPAVWPRTSGSAVE